MSRPTVSSGESILILFQSVNATHFHWRATNLKFGLQLRFLLGHDILDSFP
jgi:hypothetical protein